MLNSIVGVLLVATCTLNLYIHNYPILHGCGYSAGAVHKILAFGDPQITGAGPNTGLRKRVDIRGNDLFLQHTASTLRRYLRPDTVFVMGDLISSQWISTPEFEDRAARFAAIFGTDTPASNAPGRVFNLSGNHDIGYHGEMTDERVERYLDHYGALNYIAELAPGLRAVAINSMAIDGPPQDKYYDQVHEFLETLPAFSGQTVLLTHIPLYKQQGICSDGPMFKYYENGNVRDQNHLSEENSIKILNRVFGGPENAAGGVILTGHDHEGCVSSYNFTKDTVQVSSGLNEGQVSEITVRSLMGEYGGNGGLLSVLQGDDGDHYTFEYQVCRFQVQHIWWVTEIVTYVTIVVSSVRGLVWLLTEGKL